MEQTEKYKLNKPGDNDYGDVSVLNENMDKIEAALVAGETGAGALQEVIEGHVGDRENPHGATAAQVGARPDTWMPTADDVGAVPTVRKVNGKALDRDISLSASDVGAVPTSRTVNGKPLSANISLTASDVGARPSTWTPTAAQVKARPFDRVITTQAEFDALLASSNWLGAVSVCFVGNGGILKFTRSNGQGVKIPQTVKQIQGVNGAIINVTNFSYNYSTNIAALWYWTRPIGNGYYIQGLEVNCSGNHACAFSNCTQLNNCTGTGTGSSSGTGFSNCTQLTNCTGTGTGPGKSDGSLNSGGIGFASCTQLTNCTGTGNCANASSGYALGFFDCTQLTNCTGTGTGTGSSSGMGFASCTQLTNCTGTGTAVSSGYVNSYGFYNCTQLTNCTGTGSCANASSGEALGFSNCTQLTNCTGTGTGNYSYSFSNCSYLNGCKQGTPAPSTGFLGGTNTKVDTATVVAS